MGILIKIIDKCLSKYVNYKYKCVLSKLGFCGKNVSLNTVRIHNPHNVFLYDNTNILPGFIFISHRGQFFFHQGSAAAQNLTVVTDSHIRKVGKLFKDEELFYKYKDNISENVVVEEDVWIGTNVTLLPGVTIGRGSNVGAGTVIRGKVPPYSIVSGNPGKVICFTFTPEEIIEHEKALYPEEDRLPLELLEKNYEKYFLKRLKEIKEFNRL